MEPQPIPERQPFAAAAEKFNALVAHLGAGDVMKLEHGAVEKLIEQEGREVLRQLFEDHLALRAPTKPVDEQVVGADGRTRTHRRAMKRQLMTVLGPVAVERVGYRAKGALALAPLDAQLNLPEHKYSHGVRRRVADYVSRMSFDDAASTLAGSTGASVPKRQLEELAAETVEGFDTFYAELAAKPVDVEAGLLVLSFDGTGVHMLPEALRDQTRKLREQGEPSRWPAPGKTIVDRRHGTRMAAVSVVYEVAPFPRTAFDVLRDLRPISPVDEPRPPRPRPQAKRVCASIEKSMSAVIRERFDEAQRRDPHHDKPWVALVDGNEHQIECIHREARRLDVEVVIIVDFIHVANYVWDAAKALLPGDVEAQRHWVAERLSAILWGDASNVAAGMRRSATLRKLGPTQRKPVDTCADYLLKYRCYLGYDSALAKGLPITTGVVEGACRHLVKDRLAITGARWGLDGSEAVLRLRALRANGDLEDYLAWKEARDLEQIHLSRYADANVPTLVHPHHRKPHLRLVT